MYVVPIIGGDDGKSTLWLQLFLKVQSLAFFLLDNMRRSKITQRPWKLFEWKFLFLLIKTEYIVNEFMWTGKSEDKVQGCEKKQMCVQISRSPGRYTGHHCNIPLCLKIQDSNSSNGLSTAHSPMLEKVNGQSVRLQSDRCSTMWRWISWFTLALKPRVNVIKSPNRCTSNLTESQRVRLQ